MSLTTTTCGFVVLLLTVPVVRGQNGWSVIYNPTQICALKGSTVTIKSTYTYPSEYGKVEKRFWFIKESEDVYVDLRADPDYSGRVQYHCEDNDNVCTLTISDLRMSDSAEYKFRFITNRETGKYTGSPGVTLSVTDLQVEVIRSTPSENSNSVYLRCHTSCDLPGRLSYIWLKNGQRIGVQTSSYHVQQGESTEKYSCALRGHQNTISPKVYVNTDWAVNYTSTEICAFKGTTVNITCTYIYPLTKNGHDINVVERFWFIKENNGDPVDLKRESQYRDRVNYHCENNHCTLTISDVRKSDSAMYKFRFITNEWGGRFTGGPGVRLLVGDPRPRVNVRSVLNQFFHGTELACQSHCQPPDLYSYIWYKNDQKLDNTKQYLPLLAFDSADKYQCAVKAVYAPKAPSVSVSPSGEIIEGSSVTLTCSSDANPAAKYTWYKVNGNTRLSEESELTIPSIQSSDREYSCTAENDLGMISKTFLVDVKYPPKLPSVSVSHSGEIVEGRLVTLNCSTNANPAATYTWYKDNQKRINGQEGIYNFPSISSKDRGKYYCKAENKYGQVNSSSLFIDVKYPPKNSSVSVHVSGEIVEGRLVTLNCSANANPAATYTWYKDNQKLINGQEGIYKFPSISSKDRGNYYCKSENKHGQVNSSSLFIDVKYPPKNFSVSVHPSGEIVENIPVTLTCNADANPAANYTWYKDNQKLLYGPADHYKFNSISPADTGNYYCKAENQHGRINSSSIFVNVLYPPRSPSVSVSFSGEIIEGGSVTLNCSSDANPPANYTWYKENEDSPKASGQVFTITDSRPEHSGNYYCSAQNIRGRHNSTSRLTVVPVFPKELKSAVIGIISFVLLAIILVVVLLLKRKASASEQSSEPGESPKRIEQNLPSQSDEQDDLHYASVRFLKNQADAIYANIEPAGPRRQKKECDESVVYTTVKFNGAPSSGTEESGEDPDALYSTVNKIR